MSQCTCCLPSVSSVSIEMLYSCVSVFLVNINKTPGADPEGVVYGGEHTGRGGGGHSDFGSIC